MKAQMPSTSMSSCGRRQRRGFTLIELLVVLGIIVLIMGIAFPVLSHVRKTANRTRLAADLQTIAIGLDAYKADFGDYPRVTFDPNPNLPPPTQDVDVDRPNPPSGAEILCRTMIGPSPAVDPSNPAANQIAVQDGFNGPGFKIRQQGKTYGPYISTERFKVGPLTGTADVNVNTFRWVILDSNGNPILYFPRRSARGTPTSFLVRCQNGESWPPTAIRMAASEQTTYDMFDNVVYFPHFSPPGSTKTIDSAEKTIAIMLGDYDPGNPTANTNFDGIINGNEKAATDLPYILWAASEDGNFGTTSLTPTQSDINKCDDVTNFSAGTQ